uniref:Reverse transcriptase zinc-binding domain-containing protein n=1 Tax=Davidia involucrata TaxID=16924 RepID=A0A5B6YWV0_DAVIN
MWHTKAPIKVAFFAWDAILIMVNLKKRDFQMAYWCYMCKIEEEIVCNFFLRSFMAKEMCCFLFSLFGCTWIMPNSAIALLRCWKGGCKRRIVRKVWDVALCLFWCIWKDRNRNRKKF